MNTKTNDTKGFLSRKYRSLTIPMGILSVCISAYLLSIEYEVVIILPFNDTKTTISPFNGTKTTILPLNDTKTTTLPLSDTKTTLLPSNDTETTILPLNDTKTTTLPLSDTKTTLSSLKDTKTNILPLNDIKTTILPFSDTKTTVMPLNDTNTNMLKLNDSKTTILPLNDTKTILKLNDTKTTILPLDDIKPTILKLNYTKTTISALNDTKTILKLNDTKTTILKLNDTKTTILKLNDTKTILALNDTKTTILKLNYTKTTILALNDTKTILALNDTKTTILKLNDTKTTILKLNDTKTTILKLNDTKTTILKLNDTKTTILKLNDTKTTILKLNDTKTTILKLNDAKTTILTLNDTKTTILKFKDIKTTILPLNDTRTTILKLNKTKTTILKLNKTKTTILPLEDTKTTILPLNDTRTITLKLNDTKTTILKPKDTKTNILPLDDKKTIILLLNDTKTTILTLDDTKTTILKHNDTKTTILPLKDTKTTILPLNDTKRTILQLNDTKRTILSLNDTKTTLLPLDDTKTSCRLPVLNPWDKSVFKYLLKTAASKCSETPSLMYIDKEGVLQCNTTALRTSYNVSQEDLKCSYQLIERQNDDKSTKYGKFIDFKPPKFIPETFFRVRCKNREKVIYDYLHNNMRWKDNITRDVSNETDEKLSIFVFGIDSISRSQFLRKLPQTYNFLMNNLSAYDFSGYMKVGLNSFPNLIPLLIGNSESELPMNSRKSYLDSLPYLWKEAAMLKYRTMYAEDRPPYSTFNYLAGGFRQPPTDYYFRPFILAAQRFTPVLVNAVKPRYCFGNIEQYKLQVNYFRDFLDEYKRKLRFCFSWLNQLTHDAFNGIENADETFADLFKWLQEEGHLKSAALIVVSDHGFRIGGFSTTRVGRLENSLPFLSIYLPEKVKEKYPDLHTNLQSNSKKLTTAFDLHQTIHDILYRRYNGTRREYPGGREAISLFSTMPVTRNCKEAGVPENFCVCISTFPVPKTLPLIVNMSHFIVDNINKILHNNDGNGKCEPLTLNEIQEASISKSFNEDKLNGSNESWQAYLENANASYTILVKTLPGHGLFEGMVNCIDMKIKLIGNISRLDLYGPQSRCTGDSRIKQFCYCKKKKKTR